MLALITGCRQSANTNLSNQPKAQAAPKIVPDYKLTASILVSRSFTAEIMAPTGKFVHNYEIKLKVKNYGSKTYSFKKIRVIFTNPTTKKSETAFHLNLSGIDLSTLQSMKPEEYETLSRYEIPPNTDGVTFNTGSGDLIGLERNMATNQTPEMTIEFIGFDNSTLMRFHCSLPAYRDLPYDDETREKPIEVQLRQL